MPSITELKRKGYRLQRSASLGAGVTLVSGAGEFIALFECARHCAEVLGDRTLDDIGDGILEVIPRFKIPTEDLNLALGKLTKRFSVALIDYVCDKNGGRFVPLCRINPPPHSHDLTKAEAEIAPNAPLPCQPSFNLDDY